MDEQHTEAVLDIEEIGGVGDHLECTHRNGHFNFTVEEPWAGCTETGFGASTSIGLDRHQAMLLRDWLCFHLDDPAPTNEQGNRNGRETAMAGIEKCTPGEWHASPICRDSRGRWDVANVNGPHVAQYVATEADAHMMAASKKMYAALLLAAPHREQLQHGPNVSISAAAYRAICEALRTAEGQP